MPPSRDKSWHLTEAETGQTVAAVLRDKLQGEPWGRVERLIRTRHVLVNGNLCLDGARRLKAGEVLKLLEYPTAPLPKADDVRLRHLDEHLVVVEKPSGMTSVRHAEEQNWSEKRRQQNPTLEDLLPRIIAKKLAGQASSRKPAPGKRRSPAPRSQPTRTPPVRPVHRLDRETSGLMVFARTVPAERHLGQQFRQHSTARRYLAVAVGRVEAVTVDNRLVRDRGDGRRGSTDDPTAGKRAVTHIRPLEHFDGYTLVECELETGRTHQIRIHLAELGHPVCGEKIYNRPRFGKPITDRSSAPRLALHSTELAFVHPATNQSLHFQMPLPADLKRFVDRLRGKRRKA